MLDIISSGTLSLERMEAVSDAADALIDGMKELVVSRWGDHARSHGGTAQDRRNNAHAISYEGLEDGAVPDAPGPTRSPSIHRKVERRLIWL